MVWVCVSGHGIGNMNICKISGDISFKFEKLQIKVLGISTTFNIVMKLLCLNKEKGNPVIKKKYIHF